jgi:predicted TIM-barrel fold metal-dependent hydrolase
LRIDCEMHIGEFKGDPYTWLGHDVTAAELESLMDEYAIDMSIVMAPTTDHPDNKSLAAAIKNHPRLFAFAVVNPYGPGGGVPELERAVHEYGMKGLKLQPLRHGYEADGDAALKVMACAERLQLPVAIHSGAQFCLPWQIGDLARKFPTVPVIMNHMGYRYYVDGAINVAMTTPNIYLDTVLVSMPGYLSMAVNKIGAHRVIYGSDYPTGHPSPMMAAIKVAKLKPEDEALVLGGTLARLMKLEN